MGACKYRTGGGSLTFEVRRQLQRGVPAAQGNVRSTQGRRRATVLGSPLTEQLGITCADMAMTKPDMLQGEGSSKHFDFSRRNSEVEF